MNNYVQNEKEDCQHVEYCGLALKLCLENGLTNCCQMQHIDVKELPLLQTLKERVERDALRAEF